MINGSFVTQPSRTNGNLSARPHTPHVRKVYSATSPRLRCHRLAGTESHDGVVLQAITVPRAPSPEGRCDRHSARDCDPCPQALPRLSRSYGLMRQTEILPRPRVSPCAWSLCRLLRAPAGHRPFPALSPRILPRVPGPLPRRSPWCTCSFLPMGHRPSPFPKQVGKLRKSRTTTSVRRLFSRLQSFADVQAPGLARHPGRSHHKAWFSTPRAAVTFTSTHISVRYLPEQWIC